MWISSGGGQDLFWGDIGSCFSCSSSLCCREGCYTRWEAQVAEFTTKLSCTIKWMHLERHHLNQKSGGELTTGAKSLLLHLFNESADRCPARELSLKFLFVAQDWFWLICNFFSVSAVFLLLDNSTHLTTSYSQHEGCKIFNLCSFITVTPLVLYNMGLINVWHDQTFS